MRLRHKKWAEPLILAHKDVALNSDDLTHLPVFTCLEIGSGCGGFLIKMAKAHPEERFLGVEVAYTAFSIAVKKLTEEEKPLNNIIFINSPSEKLMEFVQPSSLKAVYLNFSDPWPKKRHHKRRLTYPTKLAEYYKALKLGGKLTFKTDDDSLYHDSIEYFKEFGLFTFTPIDNYLGDDMQDQLSEYEEKFRSQGVTIHRIVAIKEEK